MARSKRVIQEASETIMRFTVGCHCCLCPAQIQALLRLPLFVAGILVA